MAIEELYCRGGDHNWTRESRRGRKPPNCPEHNGEITVQIKKEGEEAPKRALSSEHKAALLAGRQRRAEEKAEEYARIKKEELESGLERVRKAIVDAIAMQDKYWAIMRDQGGPGNCSDKAFNNYATAVDRLTGLTARESMLTRQLCL